MKKTIIITLSLIAFLISSYLYFQEKNINCALNGCNNVLSSPYSKIFNIDNSLLGMFYFFISGFLAILNKENILKFISFFAFLYAFYLIFVMLFILKEICYYCLMVDLSAIIILILSHDFRKYFQKIFRG
ncbi:MAG: vitamin K epoxide reductase family protein [Candidatus Pacebacteria bacterium]|nr:vitamin K epoxide reductase family protein [Candidatus Paceibacterota bacterium]